MAIRDGLKNISDKHQGRVIETIAKDVVDSESGEILDSNVTEIRAHTTEPPYVKVYLDMIASFVGIKNVSTDFLMEMCKHIQYTNEDDASSGIIVFNRLVKDSIAKNLKIGLNMVEKYRQRCLKAGVLVRHPKYRGIYIANPYLIAKGKWDSIKKFQANFDFVDGNWEYQISGTGTDGIEHVEGNQGNINENLKELSDEALSNQ